MPTSPTATAPLCVDLCIIGLGPGGLIAALTALTKGFKVAVVEKRDSAIRGQVMIEISPTLTPILTSLGFDPRKLPQPFQIKTLERALRRQLLSTDSREQLYTFIPWQIEAVSADRKQLKIAAVNAAETQIIRMQHVLCCDGSQRQALRAFGVDCKSFFVERPTQAPHPHVGFARFTIKTAGKRFIPLPNLTELPPEKHRKFKRHLATDCTTAIWSPTYLPIVYGITHGQGMRKLNLACDIPNPLHKDPAKLLSWLTHITLFVQNELLGNTLEEKDIDLPPPSRKHGAAKDKLRLQTTTLHLDMAIHASLALPSLASSQDTKGENALIIIGDALASSWHIHARGAQSAMYLAAKAIDCIDPETRTFDHVHYQDVVIEWIKHIEQLAKRELKILSDVYLPQIREFIESHLRTSEDPQDQLKNKHSHWLFLLRRRLKLLQEKVELHPYCQLALQQYQRFLLQALMSIHEESRYLSICQHALTRLKSLQSEIASVSTDAAKQLTATIDQLKHAIYCMSLQRQKLQTDLTWQAHIDAHQDGIQRDIESLLPI